MAEPTVEATRYTVSLLPETALEYTVFAISVERRVPGGWAVLRNSWCLSADGEWEFEPRPSERTDEWIASHRFTVDRAIELAKAAAHDVTVNGWTAAKLLEMGGLSRG